MPQLWTFLVNTLTVYALFVTPFVLVFPLLEDQLRGFELFLDICFTIDIILNFFKLNPDQKESELPQYRWDYIKGLLIVDCVAVFPGLVTGDSTTFSFCKLARFVHWRRFFDQLNLLVEKVLMNWLGYTRQKVSEFIDFIELELGVILLTHIMAVIWIKIGMDKSQEGSWVNNFVE